MTEEVTQISDYKIAVVIIISTILLGSLALYILDNITIMDYFDDFIDNLKSKKWPFKKSKYKIVEERINHYKIYQQTKIGIWVCIKNMYGSKKVAKLYIYDRFSDSLKNKTEYITLEPKTNPNELIESKTKTNDAE